MGVFRLEPVPEEHGSLDWQASTYRGVCHVGARDEDAARHYATQAFAIAVARKNKVQPTPASPWGQGELVTVTEIAHVGADEMPEGFVTTPDANHRLSAEPLGDT